MTLTENDYPMATVDDLNVLLDTLAHEADRKSVYILQLPAVTYDGGLTMKISAAIWSAARAARRSPAR